MHPSTRPTQLCKATLDKIARSVGRQCRFGPSRFLSSECGDVSSQQDQIGIPSVVGEPIGDFGRIGHRFQ